MAEESGRGVIWSDRTVVWLLFEWGWAAMMTGTEWRFLGTNSRGIMHSNAATWPNHEIHVDALLMTKMGFSHNSANCKICVFAHSHWPVSAFQTHIHPIIALQTIPAIFLLNPALRGSPFSSPTSFSLLRFPPGL